MAKAFFNMSLSSVTSFSSFSTLFNSFSLSFTLPCPGKLFVPSCKYLLLHLHNNWYGTPKSSEISFTVFVGSIIRIVSINWLLSQQQQKDHKKDNRGDEKKKTNKGGDSENGRLKPGQSSRGAFKN